MKTVKGMRARVQPSDLVRCVRTHTSRTWPSLQENE